MIDQQTINQIFETADIVEVISDYVTLKKSGSNYKGLSPFTNEKTPSFFVSPAKGIFKDFSSGKGGNVVGFLMEHEKLTYPEALRYLAKKYNIPIEEKELTADEIQLRNERESLLAVTAFARSFFRDQLGTAEGKAVGMSYLRKRGFRDDIIVKFEIGYSPEDRKAFSNEAKKKGYRQEYLVKTGLSIAKEDYLTDRFHGRVIFPIHALSGHVIGFGGRTLKADKSIAKYLNSPESDIYHKGKILYGLFQAKKSIVSEDKCFLVEGYTDVTALHQAGITNVVSSSGTALTNEQIRLIKRFTNNITIIYDGDEAGITASFRGIDMILEAGMNIKVLPLPDGEDPDSFSRSRSASDFLQFIKENEKDFISFKTHILLEDTRNDPIKRTHMITDIVRSIAVIPDGIARSVFLKECSMILDVEEQVLYNEVNRVRRQKLEQRWKTEGTEPPQITVPQQPTVPSFVEEVYSEYEEREIIYFLLKFGNQVVRLSSENNAEITVAQYIIREIQNDELEFTNLVYKKIFEDVKDIIEHGEPIAERTFIYHDDARIRDLAVDIYTSRYELSKVWKRKESYVELPGENLGFEVPKSLLSYKMKVVDSALSDLRKSLEKLEKSGNLTGLNDHLQRIRNLERVKRDLSVSLGGRTVLR
ncbi:MAG: DNA primase [Bacteroidales bacterium]|nr:DNA primase [Bacteroidales bacterium]MBN2699187.1 DNA primase [Bacteroidales bacterium]